MWVAMNGNVLNTKFILDVLETLLGEQGCPWDREQTSLSLCDYLLEECFELVEAVRSKDPGAIAEELGDVFFLLFFMSVLLEKEYDMVLQQVWEEAAQKMVRRHPHVFSDWECTDKEALLDKWAQIKQEEKKEQGKNKDSNPLSSIPRALPPLLKAYRINSKAARMGFTWESDQEQERAFCAEWEEWLAVRDGDNLSRKEEEFGDLLFSLVEHGRRYGVKANTALHIANNKFLQRVKKMFVLARQKGLDFDELDLEGKDKLWTAVKALEEG